MVRQRVEGRRATQHMVFTKPANLVNMPESIVRQYHMPHSGCMRETIDLAYDETEIHPVMTDDTVEITVFNRGIALFMKRDKQIRHTHRVLRKLDALGKD